jgi:phosphoglycerate dehydrogenase-like enzyme
MHRLAILDDYQNVALTLADWDRLAGKVEITVFTDHVADVGKVAQRLQPFDIILMNRERTPFGRELLEKLPNLKLLCTSGMVNRSIDIAFANARGIAVCGSRSISTSTPELTWGLILALARNIPREDRNVREGRWQDTVGIGLAGRTLGVIGLGNLGVPVAKIGLAFGMTVTAWSANLTQERADKACPGVRAVTKDALMRDSDFITIHMPHSPRSEGIVAAADIAKMKPSAFFINTSRAALVDEDALHAAARGGKIAGVGIDVYGIEPLPPDHPVRSLPNSVLTPHLGFVEVDAYRKHYGEAVENIENWLNGTPSRLLKPPPD